MDSKMVVLALVSISMASCGVKVPSAVASTPLYKQPARVIISNDFKHRAKTLVVAIIDTGISDDLRDMPYICKMGHKDFTGTGLTDHHGHGSHISGLIQQYVTNNIVNINSNTESINKMLHTKSPYCQVILKYYDPTQKNADNLAQEIAALRYAIDIKVDYINFSGGGTEKSKEEMVLIEEALNKGIKIVVAAGNEHANIDEVKYKAPNVKYEHYYPADLDSRLVVVGNLSQTKGRCPSSNFGNTINSWEVGENSYSTTEHGFGYMTGTSQSTAIKSGKLIRKALSH